MTKMRWERAKKLRPQDTYNPVKQAAERYERSTRQKTKPKLIKRTKSARGQSCDIWQVIGADCPWNPTPGERLVRHITTMAEARAFGLR